uniref:Cyclin N-terminal domain-containing protein n=1 Tax=Trichuris muris TaxID=70415 RepID=A0A5S6QFQ6_TRIMR
MRRLKAESHFLSVAGDFLRNIDLHEYEPKSTLPETRHESERNLSNMVGPLSGAKRSQVEVELLLESDNMFETDFRGSPLFAHTRQAQQYTKAKCAGQKPDSCSNVDMDTAAFQCLSEVFSGDMIMQISSGSRAGENELFESQGNNVADICPSFRFSRLDSADGLLGRRLAIVLFGMPSVIFSVVPPDIGYSQKRHHTLSKTSECSESPGLRPSFEGVHLASGGQTINSAVNQVAQNGVSFMECLNPSQVFSKYRETVFSSLSSSQFDLFGNWDAFTGGELSSFLLDDTEFKSGGHKTALTFVSYMTSIIEYADPADIRRENNEKFRHKYPEIQLSYSKYISIKREMREIAASSDMEHTMLAQAFSYFDQCILKRLIDKTNRKYLAGVCLLLSAKLNDFKGARLRTLLEHIEEQFRLWRVDLFKYELPVAVALDFALHLPPVVIATHYQKLAWES